MRPTTLPTTRATRAPTRARALLAPGLLALALLHLAPAHLAAQVDTTQTPVDSVVVTPEARPTLAPVSTDTVAPMTPRGAFARSIVVPGWGQGAFRAHVRGGVYFAGWAANWFMIFRNQVRLNNARARYDLRAEQILAELLAASPDPDSLAAAIDTFPDILDQAIRADEGEGGHGDNLRKLVRAREQQREDWIAWSIFWALASGVDAYVTAHLADFPTDNAVQRNADRSVSVGLQIPLPTRRRP